MHYLLEVLMFDSSFVAVLTVFALAEVEVVVVVVVIIFVDVVVFLSSLLPL